MRERYWIRPGAKSGTYADPRIGRKSGNTPTGFRAPKNSSANTKWPQPAYKTAPHIHTDLPGKVVHFNEERKFGFIEVPGVVGQGRTGTVFVDASDAEGHREPRLNMGLEVLVDIVQGKKGLQAVNVRIL